MAQSSTFNASSADGYERLMGRWSRRLAVPFLEFVKVSDGDRVLDVGCGTGSLSFAAAKFANVRKLVGVDLAAAYIERARRDCADERITFHQGDAFDLPLDDGAFDRVFCFLVLQFIPDPARAIAEMRRKTRPGDPAKVCKSLNSVGVRRMTLPSVRTSKRAGSMTTPATESI